MNQLKRARTLFSSMLLVALVAILLLGPRMSSQASAQDEQGVKLTANFGLGGFCKSDAWVPVRVILENSGPDIQGRVQITFGDTGGGQSAYGQDILLPTSSRKEIFLYFYLNQSIYSLSKLKVSLVAGGESSSDAGTEFAQVRPQGNCQGSDRLLVGAVADNPPAFDVLADIQPLRGDAVLAHLRVEDLPDRALGYSMLDALVISGVDTSALSQAQQKSLELWVANGGKLLVTGGPQWQPAAAGLQDLLPVHPSSTQTVSSFSGLKLYLPYLVPPEEGAILASGQLQPGSMVLAAQEGVPLLFERQLGFGKVFYLSADPALRPLSGWDGMQDFYSQLLGSRTARPQWMQDDWEQEPMEQAASTIHGITIPSYVYICGWLAVYVVIVGPLNFFFLKRYKRRELAWITVPGLVILFSAIAYIYGAIDRGPRPVLNRLAVVQSWDGVSTAQVRGLAGLYSPRRSSYTLEAGSGFMFFPPGNPFSNGGAENWLSLRDGESMLRPDLRVEIGGVRTFSLQGNVPALNIRHNLVMALRQKKSPTLTGTITNGEPFTLSDAMLVTADGWLALGDLSPGESGNVRLTMLGYHMGDFYGSTPADILKYSQISLSTDEDAVRRTALMQAAMLSSYRASLANGGLYLVAWADQPVLPLRIQNRSYDSIDTTLYISRLEPSVKLEEPKVLLTGGLFVWEASEPNMSPFGYAEMQSGNVEFLFRPAFPMRYRAVDELTLEVESNSGSVTGLTGQLWDFTSAKWSRIPNIHVGTQKILEPWRYVGPAGEIRIKLSANTWIQLDGLSFNLVVQK